MNFEKPLWFLKIKRKGKIQFGPTNGSQSFREQVHDRYNSILTPKHFGPYNFILYSREFQSNGESFTSPMPLLKDLSDLSQLTPLQLSWTNSSSSHQSLRYQNLSSSTIYNEGIFLCRKHEHPIILGTLSHAIRDLMAGQERKCGVMIKSRIENYFFLPICHRNACRRVPKVLLSDTVAVSVLLTYYAWAFTESNKKSKLNKCITKSM